MNNYKNGVYIAFAAEGGDDVTKSDMKYYNLLKAWDESDRKDFTFVNSHEKKAIREKSKDVTIENTLKLRLRKSKLFVLLVGEKTKLDDDFVPLEIEYAIDVCKLPVVVCYVDYKKRLTGLVPQSLLALLHKALYDRMANNTVKTLHIPFKEKILKEAIKDINLSNHPTYQITVYNDATYNKHYGNEF